MNQPPEGQHGRISVQFVAIFYAFLALLGWGLAELIGDYHLLVWHSENDTSVWLDAGMGVAVGIAVIVGSRLLDRVAEWARELAREFGKVLGDLSVEQIFALALASGIGEELFFRGFLQQVLSEAIFEGGYGRAFGLVVSSLVFGLLHIGPDIRKFFPWTIMALIFGAVFGGMFLYTGNLLAPILAHFTINFFNLMFIVQRYGVSQQESDD